VDAGWCPLLDPLFLSDQLLDRIEGAIHWAVSAMKMSILKMHADDCGFSPNNRRQVIATGRRI
jgi:hypothetical protein